MKKTSKKARSSSAALRDREETAMRQLIRRIAQEIVRRLAAEQGTNHRTDQKGRISRPNWDSTD